MGSAVTFRTKIVGIYTEPTGSEDSESISQSGLKGNAEKYGSLNIKDSRQNTHVQDNICSLTPTNHHTTVVGTFSIKARRDK